MYAFLIDNAGRILSYHSTTDELVKAETERPIPPHPKIGIDYVEYWDKDRKKIVLREVERPLTESEKVSQSIDDINQLLAEFMAGGEQK